MCLWEREQVVVIFLAVLKKYIPPPQPHPTLNNTTFSDTFTFSLLNVK